MRKAAAAGRQKQHGRPKAAVPDHPGTQRLS
jgi:hypothetical protein